MPEIEYTWDDVSRLGDKVNDLDLSQAEHALMAAMLGLANDMIAGRCAEGGVEVTPDEQGTIEYDDPLPELGSQVSSVLDPRARGHVTQFKVIPGGLPPDHY